MTLALFRASLRKKAEALSLFDTIIGDVPTRASRASGASVAASYARSAFGWL
jgi:hypothetical protein